MENIECNILGSGPSRKLFVKNNLTSIGCNIPYCEVDWIILQDYEVILKYIESPQFFFHNPKFIISNRVYDYLKFNNLLYVVKNNIKYIFKEHKMASIRFHGNTGHYAAEFMINQGFTKLNLYGMDNYFGDLKCLENFSHEEGSEHYLERSKRNELSGDVLLHRGLEWKRCWDRIIKNNRQVTFNFVQ